MVVLPGEAEFQMGSPDDETGRRNNEGRRTVRIRPFDIAATEVTVAQFRVFADQRPDMRDRFGGPPAAGADLPQTMVSWYDAAAYCNWLSERVGIPPEQWCYQPDSDGRYAEGMRVVADFPSRRGYRLPTEPEWEYACRAGTVTSRFFGGSDELLLRYACCLVNSTDGPFPAGSLMPNPFGLFDIHGNVFEWCQDGYDRDHDAEPADDIVNNTEGRLVRGNGWLSHPRHVRSATRYRDSPELRNETGGFRVVRSCPGPGR
jgi:hypothetical protein